MRLRSSLLTAALAALAVLPAAATAATAAPDREGTVAIGGEPFTWSTDVATGAVFMSDVAERVPACSPVFSCDATLIRTGDYGNLLVEVSGQGLEGQETLADVDLHVYVSNADGAQGELLMEDTSADAQESVLLEDVPAGYYLVYVDWYLGAGSVDGTATLQEPTTPTDDPPAFVPAEGGASGGGTAPERQHTFASTADEDYTWTGAPGGGLSDVQPVVGCRQGVNCDYTLFKVDEAGVLTLQTAGDQDTLIDGDIRLYASDADGSEGEELGAATNFTPDETLSVDVEPGYYLMMYAYSGAGTYTGTASLDPAPVYGE